jgi:hypothetical protein
MKKITIRLESDIEFIPSYIRRKKTKHLECKFLFIRLIIKGLF